MEIQSHSDGGGNATIYPRLPGAGKVKPIEIMKSILTITLAKKLPLNRLWWRMKLTSFIVVFSFCQIVFAQRIEVQISGSTNNRIYLSSLSGERLSLLDSTEIVNDNFYFPLTASKYNAGLYRITIDKHKWIDIINDNEAILLKTNASSTLDSLQVITSESNKLYYSFLKINKQYKVKTELLQLLLSRYPKDDEFYITTQNKLHQLQNEYRIFVSVTAQKNPRLFVAQYIKSAQLPVIDVATQPENLLAYLKAHALDNVDFNNSMLINSDVFANKSIEYLTYYRNPQLPLELLEKEFMTAIDTILNKAKVNQLVYKHITEYLIDGFRKFGFEKVIDYVLENYVIKDDLCLDGKTEGTIKRRIDQAKYFKIGNTVPNIILPNSIGQAFELNKTVSRKTLIVFYTSRCPHCIELLPILNELYLNRKENDFVVIAVSLDSQKDDWLNFVKTNCPDIINVSDLKGWDGKAAEDYFIYATPTMFLIDGERKVILKPSAIEELEFKAGI